MREPINVASASAAAKTVSKLEGGGPATKNATPNATSETVGITCEIYSPLCPWRANVAGISGPGVAVHTVNEPVATQAKIRLKDLI